MKKKINVLLATSLLAVATLAACTFNGGETPSNSNGDQPTSSVDSQSQGVDLADLAQKVLAGIEPTYSGWSSKGIAGDQDLVVASRRTADDGEAYEFVIRYSVAAEYAATLSISESGDKLIVNVPNSLEGGTDIKAKIHAEVLLRGESTVLASTDFNVLVNAVAKMSLAYIYSTDKDGKLVVADKEAVAFNAMYIGEYPQQGLIFGDGEHAILVYKATLPEGLKAGDVCNIAGSISDYSGLREVGSGATVTKLDSNPGVATPVGISIDATNTPTLAFKDGSRKAEVKSATIKEVSVSSSGNATYTLEVAGKTYTAFNNANYAAKVFNTWLHTRAGETEASQPKAGDIVSFNGYVSFYNNNPQIVYCECTEWSEPAATIEGPSSLVVGAKANVTAAAKGGTEVTWSYKSSNEAVATVSETGEVSAVAVGSVTITATATIDGKSVTVSHTIEIVELKLVKKSVDEMIAKAVSGNTNAVYDRENVYEVTGVVDGLDRTDKYGNATLVNPETGKSIQLYGATTTDSAVFFNPTNGGWDFKNPQDAVTSLADIQNGELITVKCIFEDYKGTPEIMGVVTSHQACTSEYDVKVNTPENGTATLSKTKAAYGDEVEVVATPAEGYVVDKVVVTCYAKNKASTKTIAANAEGKYVFNASTNNNVTVSFKEAPAPVDPGAGDAGGSSDTDAAILTLNMGSITILDETSG
ncbi:MAG: Ig-like domain-containing protein, partial [Bacilli bacterium]|nr:Ig-like domain-containing protein [Bacilli bacterium]